MSENSCFYCTKSSKLDELMIKICDMEASTLYLFKEQTLKGRCIVAFNSHKNELFELTPEELRLYMKDVAKAAKAIKTAFNADKINYGAYSDNLPHLHMHLVPKYKDGYSWGRTFDMMPEDKKILTDDEYSEIISSIKEKL